MIEQKLHQEVQTLRKTRKHKLDTPDDIDVETEATTVLCNIVQPAQRNITLGMSLCFTSPKCNNTSSMEITQLDVDVIQPKQGKRSRFSLLLRLSFLNITLVFTCVLIERKLIPLPPVF